METIKKLADKGYTVSIYKADDGWYYVDAVHPHQPADSAGAESLEKALEHLHDSIFFVESTYKTYNLLDL